MTSPNRENLLGYLIGALEPEEARETEAELRSNPRLRRELENLRRRLEPLEYARCHYAPPADLPERTCDYIYCQCDVIAEQDEAELSDRWEDRGPLGGTGTAVASVARVSSDRFSSDVSVAHLGHRRWSPADLIVVGAVIVSIFSLLSPALLNSRQMAMRATCERNLTQLGYAFHRYSEVHGGAYPRIPESGNRAVAGIFVPVLWDQQFITDTDCLVCPASPEADPNSRWRPTTLQQLDEASPEELPRLQAQSGGSYGFPLGFVSDEGILQSPRNRSRSYYPVIADAPSCSLPGLASKNHGGLGQNVLYEDNHVSFLVSCTTDRRDDIFLNRRGVMAAGLDEDDAVIGRSGASPLMCESPSNR